jgi:hypothetical protein
MTQLEALKQIYERDGKILRPQAVVDEARAEDSPLHGAFCWDDTEAARRYRIIQAEKLIRTYEVKIIGPEDGKPVVGPMFVSAPSDRIGSSATNGYRHISDVKKAPNLLAGVIKDALRQLKDLKRRYAFLSQLSKVWDAIDECDAENSKKTENA